MYGSKNQDTTILQKKGYNKGPKNVSVFEYVIY